jgi:hypothetical protein
MTKEEKLKKAQEEKDARIAANIAAEKALEGKAEFKEDAKDGDGDGQVQDGTEFERPKAAAKKKSSTPKKEK